MKIMFNTYSFVRFGLDKSPGLRYVVSLLLNGVIIYTAWNVIFYITLASLPASYFFYYYSVEPLKNEYAVGEPLIFHSVAEWKRDQIAEWRDILRCPPIQYFSSYVSSSIIEKKKTGSQWNYAGSIPTVTSECILEAQITSTIKYGIKKVQIIHSQPFTIK